jgi:hypothetical protein
MPKSKAKPRPKAKAKAAPKKRARRWTPAALLRLAPAAPPEPTQDELLTRVRTLLDAPDTPKWKSRS